MVRRVAFGDGDEHAAAGIAYLAAGDQFGLDRRTVFGRFDDAGTPGTQVVKRPRPGEKC